jgi:hypothetical protein
MSENVHWIRSGKRGAHAEFTVADVITTLVLLDKEPMGRYSLQEELELSENSTKSLLDYGKKKGLLQASAGRIGHSLQKKGVKLVEKISQIIVHHSSLSKDLLEDQKRNYFTIIRQAAKKEQKPPNNNQYPPSWKIRDIALAYGAEKILFLQTTSKLQLEFPEPEIQLEEFYPYLYNEFTQKNTIIEPTDYVLFVFCASFPVARKSALVTSLLIHKKGHDIIQFFR